MAHRFNRRWIFRCGWVLCETSANVARCASRPDRDHWLNPGCGAGVTLSPAEISPSSASNSATLPSSAGSSAKSRAASAQVLPLCRSRLHHIGLVHSSEQAVRCHRRLGVVASCSNRCPLTGMRSASSSSVEIDLIGRAAAPRPAPAAPDRSALAVCAALVVRSAHLGLYTRPAPRAWRSFALSSITALAPAISASRFSRRAEFLGDLHPCPGTSARRPSSALPRRSATSAFNRASILLCAPMRQRAVTAGVWRAGPGCHRAPDAPSSEHPISRAMPSTVHEQRLHPSQEAAAECGDGVVVGCCCGDEAERYRIW